MGARLQYLLQTLQLRSICSLLLTKILAELEDSNFGNLKPIKREECGLPRTTNIKYGVGEGTENLIDLGELSQSGLDSR